MVVNAIDPQAHYTSRAAPERTWVEAKKTLLRERLRIRSWRHDVV